MRSNLTSHVLGRAQSINRILSDVSLSRIVLTNLTAMGPLSPQGVLFLPYALELLGGSVGWVGLMPYNSIDGFFVYRDPVGQTSASVNALEAASSTGRGGVRALFGLGNGSWAAADVNVTSRVVDMGTLTVVGLTGGFTVADIMVEPGLPATGSFNVPKAGVWGELGKKFPVFPLHHYLPAIGDVGWGVAVSALWVTPLGAELRSAQSRFGWGIDGALFYVQEPSKRLVQTSRVTGDRSVFLANGYAAAVGSLPPYDAKGEDLFLDRVLDVALPVSQNQELAKFRTSLSGVSAAYTKLVKGYGWTAIAYTRITDGGALSGLRIIAIAAVESRSVDRATGGLASAGGSTAAIALSLAAAVFAVAGGVLYWAATGPMRSATKTLVRLERLQFGEAVDGEPAPPRWLTGEGARLQRAVNAVSGLLDVAGPFMPVALVTVLAARRHEREAEKKERGPGSEGGAAAGGGKAPVEENQGGGGGGPDAPPAGAAEAISSSSSVLAAPGSAAAASGGALPAHAPIDPFSLGVRETVSVLLRVEITGVDSTLRRLPEREFAAMLGEYTEALSNLVAEDGGVVVTASGAGTMVIFNCPARPMDIKEAASRACRCAIRARSLIAARKMDWAKLPWMTRLVGGLGHRCAIVMGRLYAGITGTSRFRSFDVFGAPVRMLTLAVRLNRLYGAGILVTEEVLTAAGGLDQYAALWIDSLLVGPQGQNPPIALYELNTFAASATPAAAQASALLAKASLSLAKGKLNDCAVSLVSASRLLEEEWPTLLRPLKERVTKAISTSNLSPYFNFEVVV